MSYEIGYRRPPASGRFKKGKSGNPSGRPKGSKNFLTLLEQELGQPITINENGKKKTITRMQAMIKRMVADALQGNVKSQMSLVDILRRTGKFEEIETDALLPDNFEEILDAYVDDCLSNKNKTVNLSKSKEVLNGSR